MNKISGKQRYSIFFKGMVCFILTAFCLGVVASPNGYAQVNTQSFVPLNLPSPGMMREERGKSLPSGKD